MNQCRHLPQEMCDKRLASPYFGRTILWQNDILAKQYFGKMVFWQNDIVTKQYFGKMVFGIHTGRFPNKHTVQSKRFCKLVHEIAANWMAEEPPTQRSLIFTGKTAARTSWSKRTPRSPNYVLLRLILIYWCDCAALFAAPRVVQNWVAFYHHGCRDAGTPPCMNMLWSQALPIRDFRVKTVQQSLNLRLFGHENHVSWSFYRFMLRDKRHDLQVLWFEAGSTNSKQTQLSQLLQRHTVPTYPWHLFDWTFSFYIVHLCLTFQTVGVQNPKHDWAQLPCCRHNTWKQWDNSWMLGKWLHCWFVLKLDNVLVITAH